MAWLNGYRGVLTLALICVGVFALYALYVQSPTAAINPPPARSQVDEVNQAATGEYADIIATYYEPLIPLTIGTTTLQVSVADTRETRIQGLSDTPLLPPGMGKLFIFATDSGWSIWMKDMQYPLDIIWLDAERTIVHVETGVLPDTYPELFSSPTPARYVLEVNAGAAARYGWTAGDTATW